MRLFYSSVMLAASAVGAATAQTPNVPLTRVTGVIGISGGQTARLNVLNPGAGAPLLGMQCQATLNLLNDQGQAIKSSTATIIPGTAASLELTPEAFNGRLELYAVVSTPPLGQAPNAGFCNLIPTIEVLDSSGNTVAVLTGSVIRPPVPDSVVTATRGPRVLHRHA